MELPVYRGGLVGTGDFFPSPSVLLVVGFEHPKGVHNIMPRAKSDTAKSSAELYAEIETLKKAIDEKKKLAQAAQRTEQAEAARIKAAEEARFNKEFVEKAKEIRFSDYESDGGSVYEVIKLLIRPPAQAEQMPVAGVEAAPKAWMDAPAENRQGAQAYGSPGVYQPGIV